MTTDPLTFLRAAHVEAEKAAEAARDVDYAQCGVWEARGPYPAASGEADGVLRPRGNLRAEIGTDDIFLGAELPWDLIPHMALHHPAAALRRIAAERALIADCDDVLHDFTHGALRQLACDTIHHLAEAWGWTRATGG